ncbi:hypothetical protein [Candidatus Hodgkinia cicadicola]
MIRTWKRPMTIYSMWISDCIKTMTNYGCLFATGRWWSDLILGTA